ncbi:EF-P lysine aminoacylase GenX [bacterium]|nr:EF-P lysine aminoacylase GenX [bacterium]
MTEQSNWQELRTGKLNWTSFRTRARIIRAIRRFFESEDFMEVEPPLLTPYPTLDSHIQSMKTCFHKDQGNAYSLFLHTSPEHAMKKLLAGGAERIFYLGKVFRDQELTPFHNPEFTLLEWYRTDATYKNMMEDAENLICRVIRECLPSGELTYQNQKIDLILPWERRTLQDLFQQETGIDLKKSLSAEILRRSAVNHGIHIQKNDNWETIFFKIFLERIEPKLGRTKPLFVMDYPLQMGLMAKKKEENPDFVERIELYMGGLELANGYSELTDPDEQQVRFLEEQKKKEEKESIPYETDNELLSALRMGLPPCAGMALGIDRLVMLLTNEINIQHVVLFPAHQWRK